MGGRKGGMQLEVPGMGLGWGEGKRALGTWGARCRKLGMGSKEGVVLCPTRMNLRGEGGRVRGGARL